MKIAILASEGAPYCKSGGLGDVMEALPAALQRIEGNEVVLVLPYYKKIKDAAEKFPVEKVAEFVVTLGWRKQYGGVMKLTNRTDGVTVYFIDNEFYRLVSAAYAPSVHKVPGSCSAADTCAKTRSAHWHLSRPCSTKRCA